MSLETIGRWVVTALKVYATYFVVVLAVGLVVMMISALIWCWRKKRGGDE